MLLRRAEAEAGCGVLDWDLVAPARPKPPSSAAAGGEWWRPALLSGRAETLVFADPQLEQRPDGGLAFRALMVFTFILLIAPQSFLPVLGTLRIALVAAVVGILAHLAGCLNRGRPLTVRRREMALAAGLAAWAVVTLPLSYWPGGSAALLLDLFFKTVAIFWLLGNAVDTLPRLTRMAWGLSLMSVPLALTGIKNFLSGAFIPVGHSVRRITGYDAGLTANPNDLALMLNIILPLTLALVAANRTGLARGLLLSIALLQVACVVVTFSRAGFLTLASVFAIYLWRLVRRGRVLVAAAAVVCALCGLAVVPGGYLERLATIASVDADPTGSSQARWNDTVAAARFVLANPLVGAGAGMNTLALNEIRGPAWMRVHNVYLEYAADLGLPGLALFLLLMFSCLRRARRVRLQAAGVTDLRELSLLAEGIEVALLAFAVAGFFYPVAYNFYFYYPAGLAVAADVLYERAAGPRDGGPSAANDGDQ